MLLLFILFFFFYMDINWFWFLSLFFDFFFKLFFGSIMNDHKFSRWYHKSLAFTLFGFHIYWKLVIIHIFLFFHKFNELFVFIWTQWHNNSFFTWTLFLYAFILILIYFQYMEWVRDWLLLFRLILYNEP